jgi:hypothetical protein
MTHTTCNNITKLSDRFVKNNDVVSWDICTPEIVSFVQIKPMIVLSKFNWIHIQCK